MALLATLLFSCALLANQLTPEQQVAKEQGIVLYNQYKAISAEPYLEIAAQAGDKEAQYYLGEALRLNNRFMTEEAYKWYAAAAEQGDYYAMYRLSGTGSDLCSVMGNCPPDHRTPGDWLLLGRKTAQALAEKGDSEAMYALYYLTNNFDWIEKSAEAGFPIAQYDLARLYDQGKGFFFTPWKRSERVEELAKKSAEGGCIKGIMLYQNLLEGKKDIEIYWTKKAVALGSAEAVYAYGSGLAHVPKDYGYPLDLVKGYGFIYMLLELDGGGGLKEYAEDILPDIASQMTAKQIEEAKAFAKEWKATHPPLSFFPPKLGF
ncbi:sel1 repeat family protein [Ectopseudomonas toyotomiensis]|nr:sel1 repeat family protein [Pseudomonas toyotomiensis]PIA69329.1 sel1 repeat family protein [Pseudomonas toyotomiensis]